METLFQDGKEEVLQAWFMDDGEEDQRLPHHCEPKKFVSLDKLADLGIVTWRLNAENHENDEDLKKIREARGCSFVYTVDMHPERLPDYEAKLKSYFQEHRHTNEETSYCLEGSGYYDVRDKNDCWIRIALKKGGMIVIPAGIYHRFTLDTSNYIKANLFLTKPVNSSSDRPGDELSSRKETFETFLRKETDELGVEAR
ncbi:acireductone dioxygenase 2-like [Musa acuminata AAA Group]|uniref:acireductone dioxygenase 2-like n=1 Tax=Musa acuminata AAA Group TaxID=214697 RepID=UPI0031D2C81F